MNKAGSPDLQGEKHTQYNAKGLPASPNMYFNTSVGCDLLGREESLVSDGFLGKFGVCSIGVLDEGARLVGRKSNETHNNDSGDGGDHNSSDGKGSRTGVAMATTRGGTILRMWVCI